MDLKKSSGLKAEKLAAKFLRKKGYRILEERCQTRFGEIDLICRKGKELVFVEVRSVASDSGVRPEETINSRKINHIVKSAKSWILKKGLNNLNIRFDVITIDLSSGTPLINHYQEAFETGVDL